MEFNQKHFYKNVFLINGWKDVEEQRFHRKRQREWYSTYRGEFGKEINIWNSGMDCSHLFDNLITEYDNHISEGYEKSGVLIDASLDDLAILYTLTIHSADKLAQLDSDGIDHGKIEIRMLACHQSKINSNRFFSMSALCFMDTSLCSNWYDAHQIAVSTIDAASANNKGIEFMNNEFNIASAKILAIELGRMGNTIIEYKMERNVTEVDGVKMPYENYTDYNINYIYGFQKMDKVIYTDDKVEVYENESIGYYVLGSPIDYVEFGYKTYGLGEADAHWGLDRIFNPLKATDETYKKLHDFFDKYKPAFIGRMMMPVSDHNEGKIVINKVYVVRCYDDGRTYFVSECKDAVKMFCY